jgi:hypothetical protein
VHDTTRKAFGGTSNHLLMTAALLYSSNARSLEEEGDLTKALEALVKSATLVHMYMASHRNGDGQPANSAPVDSTFMEFLAVSLSSPCFFQIMQDNFRDYMQSDDADMTKRYNDLKDKLLETQGGPYMHAFRQPRTHMHSHIFGRTSPPSQNQGSVNLGGLERLSALNTLNTPTSSGADSLLSEPIPSSVNGGSSRYPRTYSLPHTR